MSRTYPPALRTDLAIHALSGAEIEERGDHLVVRSPHNPGFHWGNCVWVTDPGAVAQPRRWTEVFEREFPTVPWRAIGLIAPPDASRWAALGFEVDVDLSLTRSAALGGRALPPGYTSHQFRVDRDWSAAVEFRLASHPAMRAGPTEREEAIIRAEAAAQRRMAAAGVAAWFGAYDEHGAHVAELGIVHCAGMSRYQSIVTDAAHRRLGLAGHLIGRAAQWARQRGDTPLVIVVTRTNAAARLYRSLGFAGGDPVATAYRGPAARR